MLQLLQQWWKRTKEQSAAEDAYGVPKQKPAFWKVGDYQQDQLVEVLLPHEQPIGWLWSYQLQPNGSPEFSVQTNAGVYSWLTPEMISIIPEHY